MAQHSPYIVNLTDIEIELGDKTILSRLNLKVKAGETLSIIGTGGSGKSTLLKSILGILPLQAGELWLFDKNLKLLKNEELNLLRKKIGMAFQQGALFDSMSVGDNILFGLGFQKQEVPSKDIKQKIQNLLEHVKLPDAYDKFPSELSGGMKRRVGIVRALIHEPELLLLDEPTAGLDPVSTSIIINMVKNLTSSKKTTIICVTSAVDIATRLGNNIGILNNGQIIAQDTFERLKEHEDPWIRKFVTLRELPS
jgi:phospholipid/cholesterol/gamma-HCH transport system ATP-binding protein